jgi:hypothetical protein
MAVCDVVVVSDFTRKTRTEDFRRVPHTNEQNLAVFLNYAPRPLSSRPRPGTSASLWPWRRSRPGRGGLGSEATKSEITDVTRSQYDRGHVIFYGAGTLNTVPFQGTKINKPNMFNLNHSPPQH